MSFVGLSLTRHMREQCAQTDVQLPNVCVAMSLAKFLSHGHSYLLLSVVLACTTHNRSLNVACLQCHYRERMNPSGLHTNKPPMHSRSTRRPLNDPGSEVVVRLQSYEKLA